MTKPNITVGSIIGLIILLCIVAVMVSIAVMQVVRTASDLGDKIYIVGGAVALVGLLIFLMLLILVKKFKNLIEK